MTTERNASTVTDIEALVERVRTIPARISNDGNFRLSEDEFAALVALCQPWPIDYLASLLSPARDVRSENRVEGVGQENLVKELDECVKQMWPEALGNHIKRNWPRMRAGL